MKIPNDAVKAVIKRDTESWLLYIQFYDKEGLPCGQSSVHRSVDQAKESLEWTWEDNKDEFAPFVAYHP